jgi:hypothetical protein
MKEDKTFYRNMNLRGYKIINVSIVATLEVCR